MSIYKAESIEKLIKNNSYAGRGIIIGKSRNSENAVFAYFIMGRSENSRNRIFEETADGIKTKAFDESRLKDPSLIIYSPVKRTEKEIIITNGDQTDTVYDFLIKGKTFEEALETREFEPDAPNFTPRISGLMSFFENDFGYKMSILKSIDEKGSGCARYTFSYPSVSGLGHFIHTYNCDGNPLPTFAGEPERVIIPDDIDEFKDEIWNNLNEDNRISLYLEYINLKTKEREKRLINKNK